MKILYIDPNATTSQYNYPLIEELNKQNTETILISSINLHISTYYRENYDIPARYIYFGIANKIKIQKLRRIVKVLFYPFYSIMLLKIIKKLQPDVIHYNWLNVPPVDQIIIKLLKKMDIPVVITQHNYTPHENKSMLPGTYECLKYADKIICLSKQVKNRFPVDFQHKVEVINHGNTYKKEILRYKNTGVDKQGFIDILMIGSIKPYKGVMLLLKAFSELVKEKDFLRLNIIGKCDKSLKDRIENYVAINNLGGKVIRKYDFITYEEMLTFIEKCDLGVLPYKWGSQSGLPYLFYAFNKPLLLSNSCGISEQGNAKISIIVEPETDSVKNGIVKFLERKDNFTKKDFEQFLKENSIERVASELVNIYKLLIKKADKR